MKAALAVLLVLSLSACSQLPQSNVDAVPASSATSAAGTYAEPPASGHTSAVADDATTTLAKYHWQLASATDESGQRIDMLFARADKPLQLDFNTRSIAVSNTCNRMHGSYSVTDGKLSTGQLASTMRACPEPKLMALDMAVGKYLSGTLAFTLDTAGAKPALTLTTAQGDKLVFDGEPTAETRYGGAGETVFLEVAPETKSCNHPLMPNARCLYVRELHYGANGVRAGKPGAWEVLGHDIEGYTHAPGVRNVLRVKRYKIANPPADTPSTVYVLDMVVETALPPRAS